MSNQQVNHHTTGTSTRGPSHQGATHMCPFLRFLPLSSSSKVGDVVDDGGGVGRAIQLHTLDTVVVGLQNSINPCREERKKKERKKTKNMLVNMNTL